MTAFNDLTHYSVFLYCPEDIPGTIYHLRSLQSVVKHFSKVMLEDRHGLAELLGTSFPTITLVSPDSIFATDFDVIADLIDVSKLYPVNSAQLAYLMPPQNKVQAFREMACVPYEIKVGIIVRDLDVETLFSMLPRHRLKHTCFFTVTSKTLSATSLLRSKANCIIASEVVHNYIDAAALTANMDFIVTDDSSFAHIAGAMGASVLYVPVTAVSEDFGHLSSYRDVKSIQKTSLMTTRELMLSLAIAILSKSINIPAQLSAEALRVEQEILPVIEAVSNFTDSGQLLHLLAAATPEFNNVSIETTSVCNLRCSYCPNSTIGRQGRFMEEETFFRIINSIAEFSPDYAGMISPHFYGEPLLDNRLEIFVQYSRTFFPNATVQIFTNGALLSVERFLSLVNAGANKFVISQHSPTPSQRLMDVLHIIHKNYSAMAEIEYFDQYNSKMKMNRGGLLAPKDSIVQLFRCNQYKELVFDVTGTAVLCCNDYLATQTFGNIHDRSVREIWSDPGYVSIRNLLHYSFFPLPLCQNCSFL